KQQRDAAEAHYLKANRVSVFFREYTAAVETLLAALWAEYFQNSALCLMAVGGFGRGELYPCSDVDLAVVSPAPLSDGIQEQIARFVQTLWDCKLMPS
ncbi:nucleotidyltransferase domain-containing protein, partial [Enterobacter hormaechei subsp. steigerwaltii]|nr:nucleotidyltransferase domain-containing protein [Enterobacter hormaechei subsp. steigerwaltii]